ncbi:MAG: hypothetical protein LKG16_07190, partial [Bifidobacterium subtile]|nr:hypothetical protein [Bifidobacterium subtile]
IHIFCAGHAERESIVWHPDASPRHLWRNYTENGSVAPSRRPPSFACRYRLQAMAISTAAVHVAKRGFRTEGPSSNRKVERLIDTLIDGIKTLIDSDELVAEFSIHSPYLAAVPVNAFTKIAFRALDTFAKISLDAIGASGETLLNAIDMLLNTTNLPNETALDTVNTDSEALLNIIDTDSETLFNTIDTPSKTGFDFVDVPSETALDTVNASGKTLLDTVNPPAETTLDTIDMLLDTVNLPSEAAFNAVDADIRVIDALGKASVAG